MTRQVNIDQQVLVEVQRRKFEQHARTHILYASMKRQSDGRYERKSMQDCWICWLTALGLIE